MGTRKQITEVENVNHFLQSPIDGNTRLDPKPLVGLCEGVEMTLATVIPILLSIQHSSLGPRAR